MVKFVSLKCGELGLEFIENEIISLILSLWLKIRGWPRHGVRNKVRHIKDSFDSGSGCIVHILSSSLNRVDDLLRFGV